MNIKSFTPVHDWFFCFTDSMSKITTKYPLAGWAVITDANGKDEVVGMVSVTGGGQNSIMPGVCRLVIVPPVEGTYKHASEIETRTETE